MSNELQKHTRTKGDTRTPIGALLVQGGKPVDLAGKTVSVIVEQNDGESEQAETSTGVTAHPTFTFTADVNNNWILHNDHRVKPGDQIVVSSTTTLPGGLTASTRYFARDVEDNCFRLAATRAGTAIDITSAGTGTHIYYVVGSVQYTPAAEVVDAAGVYWVWFVVAESGADDHFPHDGRKLMLVVVDNGT